MKIVFLCGSLEPGSDGVGDYTRILASSLMQLGHEACCISINDPYISAKNCRSVISSFDNTQDSNIYRFSRQTPWLIKLKAIHTILESINPSWVSLQYVPYSFECNGLPLKFTFLAFILRGPWRWHFMFHELWIGRTKYFKIAFIHHSQKLLIRLLVFILKPQVVCTSIVRYINLLSQIGVKAHILTLHSNIPIFVTSKPLPISQSSWIFIFFGSFDSQWQCEPLFTYIESARCSSGIAQCVFVKLGRPSISSKIIWDYISSSENKQKYPAFVFVDVGQQSEAQISAWLLRASFGISMAPIQWIGKSGSVAAMVDHGLPVIVPNYLVSFDAPPLENLPFADQFVPIDSTFPEKIQQLEKFPIKSSVTKTAVDLMGLLNMKKI